MMTARATITTTMMTETTTMLTSSLQLWFCCCWQGQDCRPAETCFRFRETIRCLAVEEFARIVYTHPLQSSRPHSVIRPHVLGKRKRAHGLDLPET